MAIPLSPPSSVSDVSSNVNQDQPTTQAPGTTTPITNNNNNTNTTVTSTSPTSPTQIKRKPSRRANTAERRATHNAVERQRRETLNGRFLDLAALLPNLSQIRRPSKSSIVNSSIAYIHASRRHHLLASRELRLLKSEADHLRFEINEWRDRAGLMRVEEPVRGEGFGIVISGEMQVVQATLKGGTGTGPGGRGRRGGRDDGDDGDDGDEDDDGEGEDGMLGLGGYGGSYMDEIEDEMIMDGTTTSPLQLFGGGATISTSSSSMHLHHVHQQQQQMALNDIAAAAAAAHSLEDMDDPRLTNLLLKNGNPFPQGSAASNSGFCGFQSNSYNPHHHQQQQYQQPAYPLWNDPPHRSQYQMMQTQPPRSFTDTDSHHHHQQQQQQYHHPILSVNTNIGLAVDSPLLVNDKSNFRTTAVKTKLANAKANARVKTRTHSISHSHSNMPASSSPSSTHNSPPPPSAIEPLSSPASSSASSHQQVQIKRSGSPGGTSRSGSESAVASPSYELHSTQGDYVNGGGVPRGGGGLDHGGFMGLGGMGLGNGGINGGGRNMGGMNLVSLNGMNNSGHGHGQGNAGTMMMMMM